MTAGQLALQSPVGLGNGMFVFLVAAGGLSATTRPWSSVAGLGRGTERILGDG